MDILRRGLRLGCEGFLPWLLRAGARGRMGAVVGGRRVGLEGLNESDRAEVVGYFVRDAVGQPGMLRLWLDLAYS